MLSHFIKEEFTRNAFTKLAALVALPVLNRFKPRVDHRRYNGAALLGLRGLVFKSHGSADAFAFEQALNRAHDAARNGLLDRVQDRIAPRSRRCRGPRATPATTARSRRSPPSAERSRHDGAGAAALFAHHRHRQLSAARPADQRRPRGATGQGRHRDLRRLDRRAHRHPRAPLRRARTSPAATSPFMPRDARSKPPTATRGRST